MKKDHAKDFAQRMENNGKLVVITGAAGYIGSTLTDILLRNGLKVRAVDNFWKGSCDTLIPFVSHPNFEFQFGDVASEDIKKSLKGADYIIHAAALVGFPICKRYPELASLTNVIGTNNVLSSRPQNAKLILTSTGSVYGEVKDGLCTEETPVNPLSVYGTTKLHAERLCLDEDNTIIHRYATAFGVGFATTRVNLLFNDFVYKAVNERSLTVFEADFRRTFVHVRDICSAIFHTILHFDEMQNKHRVYNVGHRGLNLTKREIAELIKAKTGCHVVYEDVAKDLDARNYGCDFSRIYESGWYPIISIEQGLEELVKVTPMLQPWTRYN